MYAAATTPDGVPVILGGAPAVVQLGQKTQARQKDNPDAAPTAARQLEEGKWANNDIRLANNIPSSNHSAVAFTLKVEVPKPADADIRKDQKTTMPFPTTDEPVPTISYTGTGAFGHRLFSLAVNGAAREPWEKSRLGIFLRGYENLLDVVLPATSGRPTLLHAIQSICGLRNILHLVDLERRAVTAARPLEFPPRDANWDYFVAQARVFLLEAEVFRGRGGMGAPAAAAAASAAAASSAAAAAAASSSSSSSSSTSSSSSSTADLVEAVNVLRDTCAGTMLTANARANARRVLLDLVDLVAIEEGVDDEDGDGDGGTPQEEGSAAAGKRSEGGAAAGKRAKVVQGADQ
jgi:hypothetical protein